MSLEASPFLANFRLLSRASTNNQQPNNEFHTVDIVSIQQMTQSTETHSPDTESNETTVSICPSRALQNVLTHEQRAVIVKWMTDDMPVNGEKHICSRAVRRFPALFRRNTKANLQKASRYWRSRENILATYGRNNRKNGHSFVRATPQGVKIHRRKAAAGRGRKRTVWISEVYKSLLSEFDRLPKSGVKFSSRLIKTLAKTVINRSSNPVFGNAVTDPCSGKPIIDHITPRWVQHFMQANDIVSRSQTGKLMVSPAKQELIERSVAIHLGVLCREFRSGQLDENNVFNADETHFVLDQQNHKTLTRRADRDVKYVDVVSCDQGMTMMVLIAGGTQATLCTPFMVFQNENCSHPIRGVPDDVPGVSYRSGPKGWMDSKVFLEWIKNALHFHRCPIVVNAFYISTTEAVTHYLNLYEIRSVWREESHLCVDFSKCKESAG